MKKYFLCHLFVILIISSIIEARPFRVGMIPNGSKNKCANCHIDPAGGGPRNLFGQAVEARVTPGGTEQFWDATLAKLDSDGDGFTNGQELQDPNGTWRPGQANPGNFSLVTNPGDPASKPAATDVAEMKMPVTYKLEQNYPNPFNPSTTISFSLPASGFTSLIVYDVTGKEIKSLVNKNLSAGNYSQTFYSDGLSSGIYFYQIKSNDFLQTKKFILLK